MPVRIAIGMAVTVVALAIAGRRFFFLFRLVRAGKADTGRFRDVPARVWAELSEVAGQRKLLKKPVAGLAHFFTMWGFTILLLTIIEAYGDLFDKTFAIPGIGHWPAIGFIEDFFAVAVLVSPRCLHRHPDRERPEAARAGLALLRLTPRRRLDHPGHDRGVMVTLLGYRAAQTRTGDFPYDHSWWAFASHGIGEAFNCGRRRDGPEPRDGVPAAEHRPSSPASSSSSPIRSTSTSSWRPSTWPPLGAPSPSGRSTRRRTWTWRTSPRTPSSAPATSRT